MLDQFFATVNSWMQTASVLSGLACMLWGMIAVIFSPCHLMSLPLMVGYLAGQEATAAPRQAVFFALSFTFGVFTTIALVGMACSLLGRMLGEVGPYWTILPGGILLWVGFDMLGLVKCPMPGRFCPVKFKGLPGAFCIGLAYGIVSGSCTFGFIAPILAVITIQQKTLTGILLITLFGLGYSIPLAVAGSSAATVRRLVEHSHFQTGGIWVRKIAGVIVGLLGIYFVLRPFLPDVS